jgi:acetolactate synthase-1/2/3 large subunit
VHLKNPDFVKIAEGFGIPGKKITDPADVSKAISDLLAHDGPFLLHCQVEKEENVFPMVPSGTPVSGILLEPPTQ